MTSSSGREDAPLLADDAPNDVESDGGDAINGELSRQEKANAWFRKVWHWILNNLMIIALLLLLLGGVIALIVYFAGIYPSYAVIVCSHAFSSHEQRYLHAEANTRASTSANCYSNCYGNSKARAFAKRPDNLSDAGMRPRCV